MALLNCLIKSLLATLALAGTAAAAPISPYYLTAGDQGKNWILQGSSAFSWNQAASTEYAIAVDSDVRTLGVSGPGSQYTLDGVYTSVGFTNLPGLLFLDGTTDGAHIFSVDWFTGGVYQMDLDWSDPVLLFNAGQGNVGITHDSINNSLWLSTLTGSGVVQNRTLDGTVLSTFNTGFNQITALALDPADGTLWMGSQAAQGTFYQFSKEGTLLSTEFYQALTSQNTLGGEFGHAATAVPEPGSLAMLMIGSMTVVGVRRRQR